MTDAATDALAAARRAAINALRAHWSLRLQHPWATDRNRRVYMHGAILVCVVQLRALTRTPAEIRDLVETTSDWAERAIYRWVLRFHDENLSEGADD